MRSRERWLSIMKMNNEMEEKFMKIAKYSITLFVDHFTREEALRALRKAVDEIEEGITDISSHPTTCEPYIPYTYFSCRLEAAEVDKEDKDLWFSQFDEDEKKMIRRIV